MPCLPGFRNRALLGVMVYTFAGYRPSSVWTLRTTISRETLVGPPAWERRQAHELPVHHKAEEYLDAYLKVAGIAGQKNTPLWRTLNRKGTFTEERMARQDVFRMIKRRCYQAALGAAANCHTFRATGTTAYLPQWAGHSSTRSKSRRTKAPGRQSFTIGLLMKLRSTRSNVSVFDSSGNVNKHFSSPCSITASAARSCAPAWYLA
jgi:hypothetical protein